MLLWRLLLRLPIHKQETFFRAYISRSVCPNVRLHQHKFLYFTGHLCFPFCDLSHKNLWLLCISSSLWFVGNFICFRDRSFISVYAKNIFYSVAYLFTLALIAFVMQKFISHLVYGLIFLCFVQVVLPFPGVISISSWSTSPSLHGPSIYHLFSSILLKVS